MTKKLIPRLAKGKKVLHGLNGPDSKSLKEQANATRKVIEERKLLLHQKELEAKWDKEYAGGELILSKSPYEQIIYFPNNALDPNYESPYRNGTPSTKVTYIIKNSAPYTLRNDGVYDFTQNPGITYRVIYSDGNTMDYNGQYANEDILDIWQYLYDKLKGPYDGGMLPGIVVTAPERIIRRRPDTSVERELPIFGRNPFMPR